MKVDFNPNYNQSFRELHTPSINEITKRLGKNSANACTEIFPQIEKLANDVDITLSCFRNVFTGSKGFKCVVSERDCDIKYPQYRLWGPFYNKKLIKSFDFVKVNTVKGTGLLSAMSLAYDMIKVITGLKQDVLNKINTETKKVECAIAQRNLK